MKSMADDLCNKLDKLVVLLANIKEDNSVNFVCRSTDSSVNAGFIIKSISKAFGGNGGGSPTFANGGIKEKSHLEDIKQAFEDLLDE